jgi:hypothetical protein
MSARFRFDGKSLRTPDSDSKCLVTFPFRPEDGTPHSYLKSAAPVQSSHHPRGDIHDSSRAVIRRGTLCARTHPPSPLSTKPGP